MDATRPGAETIARTLMFAEWHIAWFGFAYGLCPRRGQSRKETLIARFGGNVMPDVRHLIVQCARKNALGTGVIRGCVNGVTESCRH